MNNSNYNLLFFDFEVYVKDWLVVIIDYKTRNKKIIINNKEVLLDFYLKAQKNNYIWVGYNSRGYDNIILKSILLGKNPYEVNNKIINEKLKEFQILGANKDKFQLLGFDVSNRQHSLKQREGFLGSKIKESDVDFNLDRKLTDEEILETIEYCTHDVEQTIVVFDHTYEEFESHTKLIETFDIDMKHFNKTKAQLVAQILGAEKVKRDDEWDIVFPDTLILNKYQYVLDWYKNPKNKRAGKQLATEIAGCRTIFAWGGVHGAKDNFIRTDKFVLADVASLYPSIMIEYDLLSRNVKDKSLYKHIRDTRIKLKKEKNPLQASYKLCLNSTYGISLDKNSPMYDARNGRSVCVTGQLLLLDLIEKIENYCDIFNINTDGIYYSCESQDMYDLVENICHEWEKRVRLTLEFEQGLAIYQKDVNNYLLVEDEKIKGKGAYVKQLSSIDYNLAIINKSLIEYLTNNKPIEETINECDNLIDFQQIVKMGGTYNHIRQGDKILKEKVLRVFATTDETYQDVYKVKDDGSESVLPSTPEHALIYNENVLGLKPFETLDKQYYITMAKKRLNDFLNGTGKKKEKYEIKGVPNEVKFEIENINYKKPYSNFLELLYDLPNLKCSNSNLDTLIKLDYLHNYSSINNLLFCFELFKNIGTCKNLTFVKCDKLNLDKTLVSKYCSKETKSRYDGIDNKGLIKAILKSTTIPKPTLQQKIDYQIELLGYCDLTIPDICDTIYVIEDIKETLYYPILKLCQLKTGTVKEYRCNKTQFKKNKSKVGDIVNVEFEPKEKMKKVEYEGENFWQGTGVWEKRIKVYGKRELN